MLTRGPGALSDGELLAVLIRTGTRDEGVLELAQRLLSEAGGSLVRLFGMPPVKMRGIKGLGMGKTSSVLAAFELGRRFLMEESKVVRRPLVSARTVYEMMIPLLKGLEHEELWVMYLNGNNYLLDREQVTKGGSSSTVIDVRQTVRRAIEREAANIILVHNHPTGNPRPSIEDCRQTEALKNAAISCDVHLLDHVIVSDSAYFSFADDRIYQSHLQNKK